MRQKLPIILLLVVTLGFHSFGQKRPSEDPVYRLYLIGDAGKPGGNPTLELLKLKLQRESIQNGVIFLGDNIYNNGMPPKNDAHRPEAEAIIDSQIDVVKGFGGDIFFIPGNHDWDGGKKRGWQYIKEQELYIENALDSADVFFPSNGCPGPIEIELTENLILVILDTQYFLQKGDKPGRSSSCGAKTAEEAFMQLHDILERNVHKKVIVASHHPIYTKGMHGGVVTAKDHLFPLTKLSPNLWIPLPIIGSIFPVYRQTLGSVQDQANLQHKSMVNTINDLLVTHKNLVHVSGHEHALQYLAKDNVNYVVSGAGSKQNTTVKQKRPSKFAGNYHGFGYIDYYADGKVWLTFESPDTPLPIVYEKQISDSPFIEEFDPEETGEFSLLQREPQLMNASDVFEGNNARAFFFGEGYRKEWYKGVRTPVFDIGKEKGGLKILKRGGGNQTQSLRLEADDGKQYVLRLLEKDASQLIPEQFRSNFVKKVVQEGISGSNPYAAFAIPPLAEAAEVYHTNPRLVFIPDDPRFGIYREDFKNKLSLFEERPAKDQSDAPYFGNSKKLINTADMLAKLYDDNDNKVDQQSILRARLLDTFLGDWDRHDDQWRWAQFNNKGKGHYYQPIPRDRDQAFYRNEGLIPTIIGSSWAVPPLQGFGPSVKNISGLWNFAVKYFDRSFLTELERKDWLKAAKIMQAQLTDTVIEGAIKQWPPEVIQFHGEQTISDLKSRRDNLDIDALKYYYVLAKGVDVVGSNKNEYFEAMRVNSDTTIVKMYKLNNDGKHNKLLYQRKFITSETKEIRLYGLDGNDIFKISGEVSKGPKIRVIGGYGDDEFTDNSKVHSLSKTWLVYDNHHSTKINSGKETVNKTSRRADVNDYNRESFKYNYLGPIIALKFNRDDGLFIGAGVNYKVQGFRKEPFKSSHKFGVTNAIATSSYSFGYEGEYTDVLGKADLLVRGELRSPNYVSNFFGIGNESVYEQERGIDYYRVRYEEFLVDAHLKFNIGDFFGFTLGSSSQMIEVEPTTGRFITDFENPGNTLDSTTIFKRKSWTGVTSTLDIDTRNRKVLTERGIRWLSTFNYSAGISGGAESYGKFTTDFTFYYSFKSPSRVTLSNRAGFAQVFGNPEFYQLNYLDGHDQMRGFRKYRFAGERMWYNNTDIDIKLLNVRAYVLPTQIGVKLFYDVGKVNVEGENSSKVHQSYGAALWIAPARILYLSLLFGKSEEGWFPSIQFGFALN
jgi:Omp85 superfamily domain/Calcineurin-like phosphoesterase